MNHRPPVSTCPVSARSRSRLDRPARLAVAALLYPLLLIGAACPSIAQSPSAGPSPGGADLPGARSFAAMVKRMEKNRLEMPWNRRQDALNPYLMLDMAIEDWTGTPEGKAAHAIQIPNPVPADSGYRPGMTQQQYFEHLCKNEAGEFIFKTADNVDTILQMRPRPRYEGSQWGHLYAIEDPYGNYGSEVESVAHQFVSERLYKTFEIPVAGRQIVHIPTWKNFGRDPSMWSEPPPGATIVRYWGYEGWAPPDHVGRWAPLMKLEYDTKPKARYGFTWRGVKRPFDREMGIGGGELIVLDLKTNEVMGVRRGYAIWNGAWTNRVCPRYSYQGGEDKSTRFTIWFILKVARSSGWRTYFESMEEHRRFRDPSIQSFK